MPLLLLFLAMTVVAVAFLWQLATQRTYKVKNRDVPPVETSYTRREGTGLNLHDLLD